MSRAPHSPPSWPPRPACSCWAGGLLAAALLLALPAAAPAAEVCAVDSDLCVRLDDYLEELITCPGTKIPGMAMAIVRHDADDGPEVIYSAVQGVQRAGDSDAPVTQNTIFNVGSISTSLTAIVLGTLVDDGLLAWDDRVAVHLPELAGWLDSLGRIDLTITDLLTHHSTLESNPLLYGFDLLANQQTIQTFARQFFPLFEPALTFREEFSYSLWPFTVAAAIAEEVSGESWDDLFSSRLTTPLGLEGVHTSTQWVLDNLPDRYVHLHALRINGMIKVLPRDLNTRFDGPQRPGSGVLMDLEAGTGLLLAMAEGFPDLLTPETWRELSTRPIRSMQPNALRHFNPFSLWLANHSLGHLTGHYRDERFFGSTGSAFGASPILAAFPDAGLYMLLLTNQWAMSSATRLFLVLHARDVLLGDNSYFNPTLACALSSVGTILPPAYQNLDPVDPPPDWFGTYENPLYGELVVAPTVEGHAELTIGAQRGLIYEGSWWFAETGYAEPVRLEIQFPPDGNRVLLIDRRLTGLTDSRFLEFTRIGGVP